MSSKALSLDFLWLFIFFVPLTFIHRKQFDLMFQQRTINISLFNYCAVVGLVCSSYHEIWNLQSVACCRQFQKVNKKSAAEHVHNGLSCSCGLWMTAFVDQFQRAHPVQTQRFMRWSLIIKCWWLLMDASYKVRLLMFTMTEAILYRRSQES